MCGSATLAMEVSSTSMNAASATVMAISQGLTRGFQIACSSTAAAAAAARLRPVMWPPYRTKVSPAESVCALPVEPERSGIFAGWGSRTRCAGVPQAELRSFYRFT